MLEMFRERSRRTTLSRATARYNYFCIAWVFTWGIFEAYCCECWCRKALTSAPCVCVHYAVTTRIRLHLADRDAHEAFFKTSGFRRTFEDIWRSQWLYREINAACFENDIVVSVLHFNAWTQTRRAYEEIIICEEAALIQLIAKTTKILVFWSEFQV